MTDMARAKQKVAIVRVREQDTSAALAVALKLIGGVSGLIRSDSRVVVKPNFTFGPTELGITNPVVIEAVLHIVSAMSPRSIVVAEGSGGSYTPVAFRAYNIYDMAARYGARAVDLNQDTCVRREVPGETGRDYVMLPRTVAECDVLISVPTYKLWFESPLSLSLKNMFGLYSGRHYGYNKASRDEHGKYPDYYLPGEIGTEMGIHSPTIEQSIAAVNLARPSDLTVIDALEGNDGRGNFIRLDLLIVGRNAIATDSVAMAMGGFEPEKDRQMQFCARMGLGTNRLADIRVMGETIEDVRFPLARLRDGIIEMPLEYCLDRVSVDELRFIAESLQKLGFLGESTRIGTTRQALTKLLLGVIGTPGYHKKAVASLPPQGRELLELLAKAGGTASDFYKLKETFTRPNRDSDHFWQALRALLRLGLVYLFHGQHKSYIILAEGVREAL
jgi:uncharacterized protein (DUF362 family)